MRYSNPLFAASFGRKPQAWCVHCHAPLPEQLRLVRENATPPEQTLLAEGVNCAACHVRNGEILTSREPSAAALAEHPVRREPMLGTSEMCGGCHQFNMPVFGARPFRYSHTPMQATLEEWRASSAAARGPRARSATCPRAATPFRARTRQGTWRGRSPSPSPGSADGSWARIRPSPWRRRPALRCGAWSFPSRPRYRRSCTGGWIICSRRWR